jgi:hypothetical protein
MTQLNRLLRDIDPDHTIRETFNRANEAINRFNSNVTQIENWEEFAKYMGRLYSHVERHVLRLHQSLDIDDDYYWGMCLRTLKHLYGKQGEKAAFEMARTGAEGGLYAVVKGVAMKMAEEYSNNEIAARVCAYLAGLSPDEQLEAVNEYIEGYGSLLPSELTEGSAGRIKTGFAKYLEQHPQLIQKLRSIR